MKFQVAFLLGALCLSVYATDCSNGFNDCISTCVKNIGGDSNRDPNKLLGCSTECISACDEDEDSGPTAETVDHADVPQKTAKKAKKEKQKKSEPSSRVEVDVAGNVQTPGSKGSKKGSLKIVELGGDGSKKVVPGRGRASRKVEAVGTSGKWRSVSDIPDEYADTVLSSHALETTPQAQLQRTLKEYHRILKPGGTAAILVVDVEGLLREQWEQSTYDASRFTTALTAVYGNTEDGEQRKNIFWWAKLKKELESAGFSQTTREDGDAWAEVWEMEDGEGEVEVTPLVVVAAK